MRVERNIDKRGNKYVLYMFDAYQGIYDTLEDARRERESLRNAHEKTRPWKIASVKGFTERLNKAIWDSNKDLTLISKQSGVSRSLLWSYQNGILPKCDNLAKLAITLNVSTDWLLGIDK